MRDTVEEHTKMDKLKKRNINPEYVRFEVFTVAIMKNAVFWDVTPCNSCKNLRLGGA
jgi:hypothetical protein